MRICISAAAVCLAASLSLAQTPAMKVTPATAQIRAAVSPATQTFTAVETGLKTPSTSFIWTLGPTGSTGSLGTITSKGVYTPPAVPPAPNTVTVTATDTTNKLNASATITVLDPAPVITSLSTYNINTGLAYTVDVKGTGFMPSYQVMLNTTAATAKFVSNTDIQITGTSTAAAGTKISVTVVDPNTAAGGKTSNATTLNVEAPVAVTLTPTGRTIRCNGGTLTLAAHVSNNSNTAVTWQVSGPSGSSSSPGTISTAGVYAAPADLPAPSATASVPVTIKATSVVDPTASASITVLLENPQPVITTVTSVPTPVTPGPVTFTINGTGFAQGATAYFAGTALTTVWVSDTKLTATGTVAMPVGTIGALKVTNPNPGTLTSVPVAILVTVAKPLMTYTAAVRFLQMASWGPTPASVVELQTIGRDAWLAKQFDSTQTPISSWPDPLSDNEGMSRLQDAFFNNAINGADQLRQRVSFALAQIMVSSGVKDTEFSQMVSYQRLLGNDAFGAFSSLLYDMTLNPAMGFYLDMVNNAKANPAKDTVANENYARESMQLFTVGLVQLNTDGTPVAGAAPEYSQATVTDMAKVLTGWTYSPAPGYASQWTNPPYYFAPMVPFESQHDTTAKNISLPIPCAIAPGGTAESDLTAALGCLAKQQSMAPFISLRLIQRLVKSNPSIGPGSYVQRVAQTFLSSGGNLQAVVTAILTDPEAMTEGSGKLTEPVLYATTLLRALNATVTDSGAIVGQSTAMGQDVMEPGSVFSYFSPFYRVSGTLAPEFQSMNAATAIARANFAWRAVTNGISGSVKVDLTNLTDLAAADPNQLVNALNLALFRGEITSTEQGILLAAAKGSTNAAANVRSALYAAAAAPQVQVQQ